MGVPQIHDNLNPYANSDFVVGKDMEEVLALLKQIRVPIKVLTWVSHGGKLYCVFQGDVKIIRNRSENNGRRKRNKESRPTLV